MRRRLFYRAPHTRFSTCRGYRDTLLETCRDPPPGFVELQEDRLGVGGLGDQPELLRLAVAHFDWVALPGNVVEATEELILQHNPAWDLAGGDGLHPECLHDATVTGFRNIETFSFDVAVPYTHEGWRGRVRASAGVAAGLSRERVAAFDADLRRLLAERFPDDPLQVAHRVFAMVCRAP